MLNKTSSVAMLMTLCGSAGVAAAGLPHAELIRLNERPGAPGAPGVFSIMQLKAVSPDGNVVTGQATVFHPAPDPREHSLFQFHFDTNEFTNLAADPQGDIRSVSGNGQTVFGITYIGDPNHPGGTGVRGWFYRLGEPEREVVLPSIWGYGTTAMDASRDGSTIVGMTNFWKEWDGSLPCAEMSEAYYWDLDTMQSPQILPLVPGSDGRQTVLTVSGDGNLFAGYSQQQCGFATAALWDRTGGTSLVTVPNAIGERLIEFSDNGEFVGGFALMQASPSDPYDYREDAFLYNLQTQTLTVLGETPAPYLGAIPTWVADDGKTVIGVLNLDPWYDNLRGEAFIWTESGGLELLKDYVQDNYQGVSLAGFRSLDTAFTSGDGQTIVGNATTDDGCCQVPYVIRLNVEPPDCRVDLNGDGVVDADDFFLFLQLFADGDSRADFNTDGVIDADDFFAFLAAFAAGC